MSSGKFRIITGYNECSFYIQSPRTTERVLSIDHYLCLYVYATIVYNY